jgi:hypothetical protein
VAEFLQQPIQSHRETFNGVSTTVVELVFDEDDDHPDRSHVFLVLQQPQHDDLNRFSLSRHSGNTSMRL